MKHFEGRLKVVSHIVLALEHEDPSQGRGIVGACGCEGSADQSYANALHLAACWNALEGMEPKELGEVLRAAEYMRDAIAFGDSSHRKTWKNNFDQALRRLRKEGV